MAALATQCQTKNEGWGGGILREGHGGICKGREEQLSFFPGTPIEALCQGVGVDQFRPDLLK